MEAWDWLPWSAHEFRLNLEPDEQAVVRLRCNDCGRTYLLAPGWDSKSCPRCAEVLEARR